MKCYRKLGSYFRGFCFENFYCVQLNSLIITHTTFYCWLSEPCKPEAVSTGNLTQSSTQKRTNLNWVAQGFVKSSSEHLQGQRINDLFWQPVPMCNTLCTDNNWPNSTVALPVKLELVSIDSNPTTLHLQEEFGSISPIPFHQLFERTRRSPPFPSLTLNKCLSSGQPNYPNKNLDFSANINCKRFFEHSQVSNEDRLVSQLSGKHTLS